MKTTPESTQEKLLVSQKEMAMMLGISYSVARQLWRSEGFPSVRIGRRCLVDLAGLKAWVAEQAERTGEEVH